MVASPTTPQPTSVDLTQPKRSYPTRAQCVGNAPVTAATSLTHMPHRWSKLGTTGVYVPRLEDTGSLTFAAFRSILFSVGSARFNTVPFNVAVISLTM